MNKKFTFLLTILSFLFISSQYASAQYCTPTQDECGVTIENVNVLGDDTPIDNSSGCTASGYTDYTSQITNMEVGATYNASVLCDPGNSASANVYIWIDWNQNGSLDDANDLVYNSSVVGGIATNFTVNVPVDAVLGNTRLRLRTTAAISVGYTPCGNTAVGESEDYTINVKPAPAPTPPNCVTTNAPAEGETGVCTNGALSWQADILGGEPTGYKVFFGTATDPAEVADITELTYTPASLQSNTTYFWKVVPYNDNGDATGCAELTFTTTDLAANATPNPAETCPNTDLVLNGAFSGGDNASATHSWTGSGASNLNNIDQATVTYNSSVAGTEQLIYTVTDAAGCSATTEFSVEVFEAVPVDVSIAITNGTNPSCTGANVEFTATPANEGVTPSYSWRVNGTPVSTGATFASTTLADADVVDVLLTSSETCPDVAEKQSNEITMAVNGSIAPAVSFSITDGANPTCPGSNIEFTAAPINGGDTPTYSWRVNGSEVGTGEVFDSSTLADADVLDVVMTSNSACASTPDATSTSETIVHNTPVTPELTIASMNTEYCEGEDLTFNATSQNEGATPTYEWFLNGMSVSTDAIYTAGVLTSGDIVSCELTSSEACVTATSANSNEFTVAYTVPVDPALVINITSGSNPTCDGQLIEFTPTPTNGGSTPTYEWFLNGASVSTDATYGSAAFADGDELSCVVTSDYFCLNTPTGTSDLTTISIVSEVTPTIAVELTQGATTICEGELVEFSANVTNEGTAPAYEWFVNGSSVSTDAIYSTSTLVDQDNVHCELTSNNACASTPNAVSEVVGITVNEVLDNPSVAASSSAINNTICDEELVDFSALALNEGANPTYEWFLNGISVSNVSTFSSSTLVNGDEVTVVLTVDEECTANQVSTSPTVVMTVNPIPATPTITADLFTLTSSAPTGNQWMENGTDIAGATDQTYDGSLGGIFSVRVTENGCSSNESNVLELSGVGLNELNSVSMSVSPNPSNGIFNVNLNNLKSAQIEVFNILGAKVMSTSIDASNTQIDLSEFNNGVYVLRLQSEVGTFSTRLVKN